MLDSVFIYLFIFKAIAVPISLALLYLPSLLYEYIVDAVSILRKLAFRSLNLHSQMKCLLVKKQKLICKLYLEVSGLSPKQVST